METILLISISKLRKPTQTAETVKEKVIKLKCQDFIIFRYKKKTILEVKMRMHNKVYKTLLNFTNSWMENIRQERSPLNKKKIFETK